MSDLALSPLPTPDWYNRTIKVPVPTDFHVLLQQQDYYLAMTEPDQFKTVYKKTHLVDPKESLVQTWIQLLQQLPFPDSYGIEQKNIPKEFWKALRCKDYLQVTKATVLSNIVGNVPSDTSTRGGTTDLSNEASLWARWRQLLDRLQFVDFYDVLHKEPKDPKERIPLQFKRIMIQTDYRSLSRDEMISKFEAVNTVNDDADDSMDAKDPNDPEPSNDKIYTDWGRTLDGLCGYIVDYYGKEVRVPKEKCFVPIVMYTPYWEFVDDVASTSHLIPQEPPAQPAPPNNPKQPSNGTSYKYEYPRKYDFKENKDRETVREKFIEKVKEFAMKGDGKRNHHHAAAAAAANTTSNNTNEEDEAKSPLVVAPSNNKCTVSDDDLWHHWDDYLELISIKDYYRQRLMLHIPKEFETLIHQYDYWRMDRIAFRVAYEKHNSVSPRKDLDKSDENGGPIISFTHEDDAKWHDWSEFLDSLLIRIDMLMSKPEDSVSSTGLCCLCCSFRKRYRRNFVLVFDNRGKLIYPGKDFFNSIADSNGASTYDWYSKIDHDLHWKCPLPFLAGNQVAVVSMEVFHDGGIAYEADRKFFNKFEDVPKELEEVVKAARNRTPINVAKRFINGPFFQLIAKAIPPQYNTIVSTAGDVVKQLISEIEKHSSAHVEFVNPHLDLASGLPEFFKEKEFSGYKGSDKEKSGRLALKMGFSHPHIRS